MGQRVAVIGAFSHVQSRGGGGGVGRDEGVIRVMAVAAVLFHEAGGDEGLQTLAGGGVAEAGGVHQVAGGEKTLFDLVHIDGHAGEDFFVAQGQGFATGMGHTVIGRGDTMAEKFLLGGEDDARESQLTGGGVVVEIVNGLQALQTEAEGAEVVDVYGLAVAKVLGHVYAQGAKHGLDVAGRYGVACVDLVAELLESDRTGADETGYVADGIVGIGTGLLVEVKLNGHDGDGNDGSEARRTSVQKHERCRTAVGVCLYVGRCTIVPRPLYNCTTAGVRLQEGFADLFCAF